MYGGCFATIPAYLRDLFGTMHVGAIHGRLLTAWSTAGVLGPVLLTQWAEYQKSAGVPRSEAYTAVLYLMASLLAIGFVCNACVSPVDARHHFPEQTT
jgi:MFS family permease